MLERLVPSQINGSGQAKSDAFLGSRLPGRSRNAVSDWHGNTTWSSTCLTYNYESHRISPHISDTLLEPMYVWFLVFMMKLAGNAGFSY